MRIDKEIHVGIISYKRAGTVSTFESFPFAHIWVPESQGEEYEKHYPGRVITIPDELDGSVPRKKNALLDASPCKYTMIIDDDISRIVYFENSKKHTMDPSRVESLIIRGFELAEQLKVRQWGISQNEDPMAYLTCRPFNFLGPVLGPFSGNLEPDLRYDETTGAKEDYDFWLQNIRLYHRTLRMNKYAYSHDHGNMKGGLVDMRSLEFEKTSIDRMLNKWGPGVFRTGGTKGARKGSEFRKETNILNSKVVVPIRGV